MAVHESRTRILIVLAKGAREEELRVEGEREREIEKDDQLDSRHGPTWYECACVYAHIHRLTRQCNLKRVRLAVATRVQEGKTRIFQSGGVRGREKRRRGGMRGSEKEREEVE